jgi:hypothetical protein
MKTFKFPDPDNEDYEIIIPREVVREILDDYLQKTYYWSVSFFCIIIGFLLGVIAS